MLLTSTALTLWAGRDTLFRGDDWDLLLYRGGFSWDVFFAPHNEHLSALLVAAYKGIPALAGPQYGAFRLTLAILVAITGAGYFVFARERVGSVLALLTVTPLLVMGGGSDNLLWPTQIGVVGSLACGIAVLILLDRDGLAAKVGACALLVASIFFSSDGLFFVVCAAIWLVLTPGRRRELWIVAVAAIAYLAWYSHYGSSTFTLGNLAATPLFAIESAEAGVGALTGLRILDEVPVLFRHRAAIGGGELLLVLVALAAYLYRARPRLRGRTVAIVALPLVSWIVIGLGRADGGDPFASRYAYASALFILMAVVELARDQDSRRLARGWVPVAVGVLAAASVAFNLKLLVDAGDYWRGVAQAVRGRTAAIELSRSTVNPNLLLEPLQDMAHMTPGWYLHAIERFGSSPTGAVDPKTLDAVGRSAADQVLMAAEVRYASPYEMQRRGGAPRLEATSTPYVVRSSCIDLHRAPTLATVTVPMGGLLIRPAPPGRVAVLLRRFSTSFTSQPERVLTGPSLLAPSPDSNPTPWHARLASRTPLSLCGVVASPDLLKPKRPASGNQHCLPISIGEEECRFRRY